MLDELESQSIDYAVMEKPKGYAIPAEFDWRIWVLGSIKEVLGPRMEIFG